MKTIEADALLKKIWQESTEICLEDCCAVSLLNNGRTKGWPDKQLMR